MRPSEQPMRGPLSENPGGLAGVRAEENSHASTFDAMKRRETLSTSGTRLTARFFGGWDFQETLYDRSDRVEVSHAEGAPMGSDLPERLEETATPRFLLSALADPGPLGVRESRSSAPRP